MEGETPTSRYSRLTAAVEELQNVVAALKADVVALQEADAADKGALERLRADLEAVKADLSDVRSSVAQWAEESREADRDHGNRLKSLEAKLAGAAGLVVLVQMLVQAFFQR